MTHNINIHVNQVGYMKEGKKLAILANCGGHFAVVDSSTDNVVYEGESFLAAEDGYGIGAMDEASGDIVSCCDFSSVVEVGEYYVELKGEGRSFSFRIMDGVYKVVKEALLKGLFYQRCGLELVERYAGPWAHSVCHTELASLYASPKIKLEVSGGWHDAGDYGRYVTAGAVSVADILLSYELFGATYSDDIGIPESGNGVPDALDEARVELAWLMKVQNKENGGVYHKVTTKQFCGMIMPEEEQAELFILPESAVATGDFAAVMSMASRVYRKYDDIFATTMLIAAKEAWMWLEHNVDMPGFQNPQDVNTGEYGDPNSEDERFWAAVELYRTTGEEQYHNYIDQIVQTEVDKISFGWGKVGGYASFSYVRMVEQQEQIGNKDLAVLLKEELLKQAEEYVLFARKDGYQVAILPKQYRWGSNMGIMNSAQLLILAHLLTGKEEYYQVAVNQLHYILGRNPMGVCYITGIGKNTVNSIHHRPSAADGVKSAVPGLLSGGPNWGLNDEVARNSIKPGTAPAKCFIDHVESYSTNEIAIYWNTPALFVAAYFDYVMESTLDIWK